LSYLAYLELSLGGGILGSTDNASRTALSESRSVLINQIVRDEMFFNKRTIVPTILLALLSWSLFDQEAVPNRPDNPQIIRQSSGYSVDLPACRIQAHNFPTRASTPPFTGWLGEYYVGVRRCVNSDQMDADPSAAAMDLLRRAASFGSASRGERARRRIGEALQISDLAPCHGPRRRCVD
jgi:hypothetical protein